MWDKFFRGSSTETIRDVPWVRYADYPATAPSNGGAATQPNDFKFNDLLSLMVVYFDDNTSDNGPHKVMFITIRDPFVEAQSYSNG